MRYERYSDDFIKDIGLNYKEHPEIYISYFQMKLLDSIETNTGNISSVETLLKELNARIQTLIDKK